MTSATSLTGSEYVPIVQTTNKKATVGLLRGWTSLGTAGQLLKVNSGATALEFFTPSYLTSVGTGVANELTYWSGTNTLGSLATATYPSLTELSYVKGLTSAAQTQLGTRWPNTGSLSLTGTVNITGSQELNLGTYASPLYAQYNVSTAYIHQVVKATSDNVTLLNASGFQISLNNPASVFKFIGTSAPSVGHVWTASNVDGTGYWAAPTGGGLTIGTTTITSGTNTRVLYNNSGVLGEYTVSGSGNVAMTTSPTFTTPDIGTATGTASGDWHLTGTSTLTGASTVVGTSSNTNTFQYASLATSTTPVFTLENPTAAAAGAQQFSPFFRQRARGWKTNATAASQTVDFDFGVTPVQGAAAPTGYWSMYSSINGAANSENFRIRSDGGIFLTGGSGFSANLYFSTDGLSSLSRGTSGTQQLYIYGPSSTANNYTVGVSSYSSNNYNYTSGTGGSIQLPGNFNPSSGSGVFNGINATGTINMTGTSSGNVVVYNNSQTVTAAKGNYTGFYYAPSVTSITGTELSFHATRGKVLFGGTTISSNTYFDFRGGSSTDKILRLADGSNNELFTFKANKEYEVTQTNGKYQERQSTGTIAATSFSETIYASTDISDGQSVTIEVLWTAKDSGANTGAGGIFYTTWTKASGTLAKAGDNQLVTNDNMTGSWAVSTSDSSGSIQLDFVGTGVANSEISFSTRIIKSN